MSLNSARPYCRQALELRGLSWKAPALFAFIIVVFGPLVVLAWGAASALLAGHWDWLALVLPTGRRLALFARSVGLAATVAASGVALGIVAATVLWRWRARGSTLLRWFVLALAPVPPYVHALAWSGAAAFANGWLRRYGLPEVPLQDWVGSWWVQWMAFAPLAVGLTLVGLESVDPDWIDTARLQRGEMETLKRVVLPIAAPAMLAGAGLLFVLSLTDYTVPSLFGMNVYALEIFAEYSASAEPARGFLLALPVVALASAIIYVSQSALRNVATSPPWRRRPWSVPPAWNSRWVVLQRVAIIILLAQVLVPFITLILLTGSWRDLVETAAAARSEILFTTGVAGLAALAALPIALVAANELIRPTWRGKLWWLLITLPLAIPAPLIGIGLVAIWNRSALPGIYGSGWMPVLAALARFAPLAAIVLVAQLRRIDPALEEAARILQSNAWQTRLQVRLPLLAPGLLAAAGIVFIVTAGELGATLIVAPPGQATLTMRIYNYLHYGASSTVAGLCLMMTAVAIGTGSLAAAALAGWFRTPHGSRRRT